MNNKLRQLINTGFKRNNWKEAEIKMEDLSVVAEAAQMPDFGEFVYSKIGSTPFNIQYFGSKCALIKNITGWVLSFVADGYMAKPSLFSLSTNPLIATVELGKIDKDAAQAVGEQLRNGELHLRAKYQARYWSPVNEEWITPLEIVTAQ